MPQRDTPQSAVQSHYNKQANLNKNQMQVMKQRKNGPLIKYKDFANSVKRRMYAEYAQGVSSLVDLACGRGGDISKWRDAGAQNVIAMDLSAAQLEDARNREEGDGKGDAKGDGKGDVKGVSRGGAGAGKSTKIVWIQDSSRRMDLRSWSNRRMLPADCAPTFHAARARSSTLSSTSFTLFHRVTCRLSKQ